MGLLLLCAFYFFEAPLVGNIPRTIGVVSNKSFRVGADPRKWLMIGNCAI